MPSAVRPNRRAPPRPRSARSRASRPAGRARPRRGGDGVALMDPAQPELPAVVRAPVVEPDCDGADVRIGQRPGRPAALVEEPVARDPRIAAAVRVEVQQLEVEAVQQLCLHRLLGEAMPGPVGDDVAGWVDTDDEGQPLTAGQLEGADRPPDHLVHVPQVRADRLGHPDPVAGVAGVAVEVDRLGAQVVAAHLLVELEAAGSEHHAVVGRDERRTGVAVDEDTVDAALRRAVQATGRRRPADRDPGVLDRRAQSVVELRTGPGRRVEAVRGRTGLIDVDRLSPRTLGMLGPTDPGERETEIGAPVDQRRGSFRPRPAGRLGHHAPGAVVEVSGPAGDVVDGHDQPAGHPGARGVPLRGLLLQDHHRRARTGRGQCRRGAGRAEARDDHVGPLGLPWRAHLGVRLMRWSRPTTTRRRR